MVDQNKNFYFSSEENIYLEIKMMEKFSRKPLRLIKINGDYFYHIQLEAFDHLGIFSFVIRHERLGYMYKEESKNVVFKVYQDAEDRRSLFLLEALPYLLIIFAVLSSAFIVVLASLQLESPPEKPKVNKKKVKNQKMRKK
jgi:hypothetical protein